MMEPSALASIATVVVKGALTRVGAITLDGTISKLQQLIQDKSPETIKKLKNTDPNNDDLQETIGFVKELIESDAEIKEVAEKIAKEHGSKPDIINMMKNVGIINQGTISNPNFNFS